MLFVILDETKMRVAQPTDRLKVTLTDNPRQYVVVNEGHKETTYSTVTFSQSETGHRLGHCTCKDFEFMPKHGKQCKHLRVSAALHLARQKAKVKVATVRTVNRLAGHIVKRNGAEFVRGIRL